LFVKSSQVKSVCILRVNVPVMSHTPRYLPLIDTHAHVNLDEFAHDFDDLIQRSRTGIFPPIRGRQIDDPVMRPFISGLICPGVDLATSVRALELAARYNFIFAAVGFHPNHTQLIQEGEWERLEELVDQTPRERLVALGETGLDRYWDDAPFELQLEYFVKTLELGYEKKLPVVIHSREANDDLDSVLRDFYADKKKESETRFAFGVVHSFSGTLEQAERWLDLGFCLGFGGFVTYAQKKFADVWEAAKMAPGDRILLETDCPFLTPHPLRGKLERNEPLTTAFVARRIAELRDVSTAEIVEQTYLNATRLFNLPTLTKEPNGEYVAR